MPRSRDPRHRAPALAKAAESTASTGLWAATSLRTVFFAAAILAGAAWDDGNTP